MKLIGSLTSPYVRKIRVMLLEKSMPFEFVNDSPWESATHVPVYNPLGKVPALIADDGEVFFDSSIIAQYVELQGESPALFPADPMEALRVKQMETLADGIADAAVAIFLEQKRPIEKRDQTWIERQEGKFYRGLDAMEARAKRSVWLCGEQMSLADIAIACVMGWVAFRLPQHGKWHQTRPALAALASRMEERPSFMQTRPPAA